jgi:hypothetical protein
VLTFFFMASLFTLLDYFVTFTVVFLTILFLSLLLYSLFFRSLFTRIVFTVLCGSHIIGLWTLHLFQDSFTSSGWTAVKQFDFSAEQYAAIFLPVIGMYFLIIILLNVLNIFLPSSHQNSSFNFDGSASLLEVHNTRKYSIVIVCVVLFMLPVHDFMFSNMVAVTGQSHLQNPLPFKIGGILFYFTKILLPLILLNLYFKARSSLLLLIVELIVCIFCRINANEQDDSVYASPPCIVYTSV